MLEATCTHGQSILSRFKILVPMVLTVNLSHLPLIVPKVTFLNFALCVLQVPPGAGVGSVTQPGVQELSQVQLLHGQVRQLLGCVHLRPAAILRVSQRSPGGPEEHQLPAHCQRRRRVRATQAQPGGLRGIRPLLLQIPDFEDLPDEQHVWLCRLGGQRHLHNGPGQKL